MAFVAALDRKTARQFYGEKLRLRLVSEDDFADVFESGGTQVAWFKEPDGNLISLSQREC